MGAGDGVALVDQDDRRLLAATGDRGDRLVAIGNTAQDVGNQDQQIGFAESGAGLLFGGFGEFVEAAGVEPGGVDQQKVAATPVDGLVGPVAGGAGEVFNDGLAAANDAVVEAGFADVGPADQGDDGEVEVHRTGAPARAAGSSGLPEMPASTPW